MTSATSSLGAALALVAALSGCGGATSDPWAQSPACVGANAAKACVLVTADVSANGTVRQDAPGDLKGDLRWQFTPEPGAAGVSTAGMLTGADLSADGATATGVAKDVEPGRYSWLAFLDDDGDGALSTGDPLFESSETASVQVVDLAAGHAITVFAHFTRISP
jgi:hypothetical protein